MSLNSSCKMFWKALKSSSSKQKTAHETNKWKRTMKEQRTKNLLNYNCCVHSHGQKSASPLPSASLFAGVMEVVNGHDSTKHRRFSQNTTIRFQCCTIFILKVLDEGLCKLKCKEII